MPQDLLTAGDSFELIVDTGCTKTATGYEEDFVDGSVVNLDRALNMAGIAGGLAVEREARHGEI
jgi:hypothetical protein